MQKKLRKLIKQYQLTQKQTANLMDVSIHTIKSYLASPSSPAFRKIPEERFFLLESRIEEIQHYHIKIYRDTFWISESLKKLAEEMCGCTKQELEKIHHIKPYKNKMMAKKIFEMADKVNYISSDFQYIHSSLLSSFLDPLDATTISLEEQYYRCMAQAEEEIYADYAEGKILPNKSDALNTIRKSTLKDADGRPLIVSSNLRGGQPRLFSTINMMHEFSEITKKGK